MILGSGCVLKQEEFGEVRGRIEAGKRQCVRAFYGLPEAGRRV